MHEHFKAAAGFIVDPADFRQREFAGQGHAIGAEALRKPDAPGIRDAHLCAGVQLDIGRDAAGKRQHAQVLNNQRVCASVGNGADRSRRLSEFMLENQRVERNVAANAPPVKGSHYFRQFFQREPDLRPCREVLQPEVNRIGARFNGSVQLRPVAGRTHDFRLLPSAPAGWNSGVNTIRPGVFPTGIRTSSFASAVAITETVPEPEPAPELDTKHRLLSAEQTIPATP